MLTASKRWLACTWSLVDLVRNRFLCTNLQGQDEVEYGSTGSRVPWHGMLGSVTENPYVAQCKHISIGFLVLVRNIKSAGNPAAKTELAPSLRRKRMMRELEVLQ